MSTRTKGFHRLPDAAVTSLLVDADSLAAIQEKVGWDIDIEKLTDLVRAHYHAPRLVYFATIDRETTEAMRRYHRWLQYRGFELVIRGATRTRPQAGRETPTTPIPVEIAMEAASSPTACGHVVMLTRNRDLEGIGSGLRRAHRTLTLLSDRDCPNELRCSATHFVEVNGMQAELERARASTRAADRP